jgi:hypothetical protein
MAAESWAAEFAALGEPDAPYDQGYDDQQDESLGERHPGPHEQSLKDRRDEADAMDKKTGRKYDDVGTMDKYENSWPGRECVSCGDSLNSKTHTKDTSGSEGGYGGGKGAVCDSCFDPIAMDAESSSGYTYKELTLENMDKDTIINMIESSKDIIIFFGDKEDLADREGWEDDFDEENFGTVGEYYQEFIDGANISRQRFPQRYKDQKDSEHHKGQGYNDELDESLGMSHKESGMKQSFKDRRDESKGTEKFDHSRAYSRVKAMDAENMGLTQYVGSAGGSGDGTPVSYGGIALPESDVAAMVESSTDNPMGASIGTVMGTMGAEEVPVVPDPSSFPQGDGRVLGQQTDQANLSPLHAEDEDVQMVKIQDPVTTGAKMALGVVALNATAIAGAALIGLALTYSARKEE